MLILNICSMPRQAFITYACRNTIQPISIKFLEENLIIQGMDIDAAAIALAFAAFPAWEKQRLRYLIRKMYQGLSKDNRERLAVLTQILVNEDIPGDTIYKGRNRGEKLAAAFNEALEKGQLNFNGFCRFRLPDYDEYLCQILLQAEDELLAEEEYREYLDLLRNSLTIGKSAVTLFFSPGDICQIWQKDDEGLRQLEGGHIRGVEWLLLANLICLDPASITIKYSLYADKELLGMLETVFGEKIIYEEDVPMKKKEKIIIDKQPVQC